MNKGIDWNAVKAGETEIVNGNLKRLVKAIFDKEVCLQYGDGSHGIFWKDDLYDWTIDDPWEEITDECEWVNIDDTLMIFLVQYKGHVIAKADPNFKSDGRRVWKRKEGV